MFFPVRAPHRVFTDGCFFLVYLGLALSVFLSSPGERLHPIRLWMTWW